MSSHIFAWDIHGVRHHFTQVRQVRCTASADSPAAAFAAVVLLEQPLTAELFDLRWYQEETLMFSGYCDVQCVKAQAGGLLLTLEARSVGCYLLDNEALPATYQNITFKEFGKWYFADYGLYRCKFATDKVLARYTVRKGSSDWQAIRGFCRQAYGRSPYLTEEGELHLLPYTVEKEHLLADGSHGSHPLLWAQEQQDRSDMLSRICIRDGYGSYPIAVDNPVAAYYKVRRKRYYIPPGQYRRAEEDAYQQLRRSMVKKYTVQAEVSGLVPIQVGDGARVELMGLSTRPLLVVKRRFCLDEAGERTQLWLVDRRFEDHIDQEGL